MKKKRKKLSNNDKLVIGASLMIFSLCFLCHSIAGIIFFSILFISGALILASE